MVGKTVRTRRIISPRSGRTLIVPLDHTLSMGVIPCEHAPPGAWRQALRPRPVLLDGAPGDQAVDDAVVRGAAAVAMLHPGSRVHDDVIDRSASRRGSWTVHSEWALLSRG